MIVSNVVISNLITSNLLAKDVISGIKALKEKPYVKRVKREND